MILLAAVQRWPAINVQIAATTTNPEQRDNFNEGTEGFYKPLAEVI